MEFLTRNSSATDIGKEAGGKGASLWRLAQAGIDVPEWAIVPARLFEIFLERAAIAKHVKRLAMDARPETFAETASKIEQLILSAEIKSEKQIIENAYGSVGSRRVAVRSSGIDEDGALHSFAGQFSSYLNVTSLAGVLQCVKMCWASAYSARCLTYRHARGMPLAPVRIAIVIQRMLDAETSGVTFTVNPLSGRSYEMLVSSVYGLGEGLVSGAVDADTAVVDRTSGQVVCKTIGRKHQKVVLRKDGENCETVPVSREDRQRVCLSNDELLKLCKVASAIEHKLGHPQDVEWAIAGGKIYILQARRITGADAPMLRDEDLRVWDNSNIIESYAGITAPLTFSFANHVYHIVYREYCRTLGVPRKQIDRMDEWLGSMLGYHNGRVYYNLLNWYKVVRLAPFYDLNRKMLDLTIGAQESIADELAARLVPVEGGRLLRSWVRVAGAALFWWRFMFVEASARRFVERFYRVYSAHRYRDYNSIPAEQSHRMLRSLMREILPEWGRMIVLEQSIGFALGFLRELTRRWLPQAPEGFFYEMTRPSEHELESMLPIHAAAKLAKAISDDTALCSTLQETPSKELYVKLKGAESEAEKRFFKQVETYIDQFGDRSGDELKLEEPDMREDPTAFFEMFRGILSQAKVQSKPAIREAPEEYLAANLTGVQYIIYRAVRAKVRRTLAARERVRFCRTRAFGMVRRIVNGIGKDLERRGALRHHRDIFWLRLEELGGWIDGTRGQRELAAIIEVRKANRSYDEEMEAPGRFKTSGIIRDIDYIRNGWTLSSEAKESVGGQRQLTGTPCSQGTAEGDAILMDEPADAAGKILVTYRTDPGWCTILPSVSGLLIERGSPLTHVAIVARELGIPTVMQIDGLTKRVQTGMRLNVDGSNGVVRILRPDSREEA